MGDDQSNSTREMLGIFIFGVPLLLAGMAMVPGWGLPKLDWPQSTYLIVVGLSGAAGAAILAPRPILGFLCGSIAALSSLGVLIVALQHLDLISKFVVALVLLVGTAPGVGLYFLLDRVFRGESAPSEKPPGESPSSSA